MGSCTDNTSYAARTIPCLDLSFKDLFFFFYFKLEVSLGSAGPDPDPKVSLSAA